MATQKVTGEDRKGAIVMEVGRLLWDLEDEVEAEGGRVTPGEQ